MGDLVTLLQVWVALAVAGVLLLSGVLYAAARLGWADGEDLDDEAVTTVADRATRSPGDGSR
jgi:hypothetical protein